ncbi:thymidine phosphorylase [Lasius niger]|uniref:Thymidine phosphorylase n=1 Tax=Lasius niger TaxID=67767 RepID=A0A0J7NBF8_LASNI|nr:thymidine phosphorylase [Lasius niger]
MLRVEVSIERISAEISDKAATLSELDTAANSAIAEFVSNNPRDKNWQGTIRAERARRRGEAGRSREGPTRTSGQLIDSNMMKMDKELVNNLLPQRDSDPQWRA